MLFLTILSSLLISLEKLWIEADDFKDPVVQYKHERPKCRPKEVHLMVLEKVSTLEKAQAKLNLTNGIVDNDHESFSITPVASPYSGNSSVAAQYSAQSSRQTSLCSSDGILPTTSATAAKKHHLKDALINNLYNAPKQMKIHVPNYKPFQARSKNKDVESSTKSAAATIATGTVIKSEVIGNTQSTLTGFNNQMNGVDVDDYLIELQLQEDGDETGVDDAQHDFLDSLSDIIGITHNSNDNLLASNNSVTFGKDIGGAGATDSFVVAKDNGVVSDTSLTLTDKSNGIVSASITLTKEHIMNGFATTTTEDEKRVDFAIAPVIEHSFSGTDKYPIEITDDKLDEILDG